MNRREQGFLLLTSQLGDPDRKPLTVSKFGTLATKAATMVPENRQRQLEEDLVTLGYDRDMALRILSLLDSTLLLRRYLTAGDRQDCLPLTRVSKGYSLRVRRMLGLDSPGCLWAKGDITLLEMPKISLVGSREPAAANGEFAHEVGRQAALQGYCLVSGNARGSDRIAQQACLAHGGKVICVVADALQKYPLQKNRLYLAENGYELPFSATRALSRNRIVHSLAQMTFVAQCSLEKGGTWSGTVQNLRGRWSPVYCMDDGSEAMRRLVQMGANGIQTEQLADLRVLRGLSEQIQMGEFL